MLPYNVVLYNVVQCSAVLPTIERVLCRYWVGGRWWWSHTWLETPAGQLGRENAFLHWISSPTVQCDHHDRAQCNVTIVTVQCDNCHSAMWLLSQCNTISLQCSVVCSCTSKQYRVKSKNGQIDWLVLGRDQIKTGSIYNKVMEPFLVEKTEYM